MTLLLLAMLLALNPQDPDTKAVLKLEDDWASALVKRDSATFERLLADGFVYTENDQTMDRAAVIRSVVAGPDTVVAASGSSHSPNPTVTRSRPPSVTAACGSSGTRSFHLPTASARISPTR